jgi:DNA-binding MarR family transcriptional regulator
MESASAADFEVPAILAATFAYRNFKSKSSSGKPKIFLVLLFFRSSCQRGRENPTNFERRMHHMPRGSVDMNFLFVLAELQRLVRAHADKQAARYGITRAQWAVLAKVERNEGLKQTELAEQMEMQPITLTRLIDRLCDNGWIERRSDDADRRVNRLYLRKAARPLLGKLSGLRSELTATALEGINPSDAHRLLAQLELIKENVRNAIQSGGDTARNEQRYG